MFLKISSKIFSKKFSNNHSFPKYEFHIAKEIRKKYEFDEEIFSITGNVVFADFNSVRMFTNKINAKRDVQDHVRPGEVNAFGLLDEIFHFIIREYEEKQNPGVFKRAVESLQQSLGENKFHQMVFDFITVFPPMDVYKGKISTHQYLENYTGGKSNYEIALEEMILLHFANFNPANTRLKELFDENYLTKKVEYKTSINQLDKFFQTEKTIGLGGKDIFSFLKLPMMMNPGSLEDQLGFIKANWGILLDAGFMRKILTGQDLSREDIKFTDFGGGFGGPPTVVPKYKGLVDDADMFVLGKSSFKYAQSSQEDYDEPEQFTDDINWMPSVVLLAKNSYVWLDQLSKKYSREIKRLDQVPDEELDEIVRRNFNGLWLIGLWERSHASKEIKHRMGNIDAVASAYSLYDYEIAHDLGGEAAYENLHRRADERGLRLASDMVPNHTGICSKWVKDHPDHFIQAGHPPFPNYSFHGPDLSEDPDLEIKIEDGYWEKRDAAVVFQRKDHRNGEVRYLYHGNDGTNMPWNDTAQLDLLKKEVREAVIQKIFDVARRFSIIRFDAAMTLTKKHFSRLWYPQPGLGGDIPTRSDYALTKAEFDELFPNEFWREVVDRINEEMPETLLLAEAFWLMEGYFVRTLGMHRVYNSAFMHMFMNEENEKYRDLITNTLEFEPEILKRYVNFMSNPDEETAIKQFGTDDKYFGVCTMMVTLPGLPMFAHGQIEGFTEKYGMEYQRAYYNEEPKDWLVERHQRQIFPLMKKRQLFSQVRNFWFFDFIDGVGEINENVFAYTNFEHGERTLILYNNRFERAYGTIKHSTPKLVGYEKESQTRSVRAALHLNETPKHFYIYREFVSDLEYITSGEKIDNDGIHFQLNGFQTKVFLDYREVYDSTGEYAELAYLLDGKGVHSIETELRKIKLAPLHEAFENMFDAKEVKKIIKLFIIDGKAEDISSEDIKFISNKYLYLLNKVKNHFGLNVDLDDIMLEFESELIAVRKLNNIMQEDFAIEKNPQNSHLHKSITISSISNYRENGLIFLLWLSINKIKMLAEAHDIHRPELVIEQLLLDVPVKNILARLGRGENELFDELTLLNILLKFEGELLDIKDVEIKLVTEKPYNELLRYVITQKSKFIEKLIDDDFVRAFLNVNYYQDVYYYSKERFEDLLDWMITLTFLKYLEIELVEEGVAVKEAKKKIEVIKPQKELEKPSVQNYMLKSFMIKNGIKQFSSKSGYKLEELRSEVIKLAVEEMKNNNKKKS